MTEFERLLEFKQHLRGKHASEYLTAFTWLSTIFERPDTERVDEMRLFWDRFINQDSETCIDFATELSSHFDEALCSNQVMQDLLSELNDCLTDHMHSHKPARSPRRRRKLLDKVKRTPSDDYCFAYAQRKNRRFSLF